MSEGFAHGGCVTSVVGEDVFIRGRCIPVPVMKGNREAGGTVNITVNGVKDIEEKLNGMIQYARERLLIHRDCGISASAEEANMQMLKLANRANLSNDEYRILQTHAQQLTHQGFDYTTAADLVSEALTIGREGVSDILSKYTIQR